MILPFKSIMEIKFVIVCVLAIVAVRTLAAPISNDTETTTHGNATEVDLTEFHEEFISCSHFQLKSEDFVVFPNRTAFVESYNLTFNSSFYYLVNDTLFICALEFKEPKTEKEVFYSNSEYITYIGVGISMLCLALHLIAFALVPDLRNLPGWNLASFCLSLLLAYLSMVVGNSLGLDPEENATHVPGCMAQGLLTQFFLLASFVWTSVMSFDVLKSLLNATGKLRLTSTHFTVKKYLHYCCYAWGIPLAICIFTLVAHDTSLMPVDYRPDFINGSYCWFNMKIPLLVYFAAPVFAVILSNIVIFAISAYAVFSNIMKTNIDSQTSVLRNNFKLYSRLAVIMGMTWLFGVLAALVHVTWLWYVFVLFNTLQGLFIFIAFTCSSKVRKYFSNLLHARDRRRSTQTLSPTFQSYYCSYANSIDKDLNGVVDTVGKDNDVYIS